MATTSSRIKHLYEFGPFRLDPQRRLLLRENVPVSLTPKALETLLVLVENRDRVVSKDELMKMLWPDSFVEESNLSQNIFLLRKVLGDSVQERRFILTVPGRGYQFTETVHEVNGQEEEEALVVETHSLAQVTVEHPARPVWLWAGFAALLFIILSGASFLVYRANHKNGPAASLGSLPQIRQQRLTANPADLPVSEAAISSDGKYLAYSDTQGIHLKLVETSETRDVPWPSGVTPGQAFWEFESWYPDSTRFVARLSLPAKPASLWSVSILGGTPLQLIDVEYGDSKVSPDGSSILFSRVQNSSGRHELWLMGPRGEAPHKIFTSDDKAAFWLFNWSPAGDRIAYGQVRQQAVKADLWIETCDLNGGNRTTLLSDEKLEDFAWVSPTRLVYARDEAGYSADVETANLWELQLDPKTATPVGKPRRLTDWSGFSIFGLQGTADGRRMGFIRSTHHLSVFVGELKGDGNTLVNTRRLTTDDHSNIPLAWTPDSRDVVFASRRTQVLQVYKQALDGNTPAQLITGGPAMDVYNVRVSPDGAWLILQGQPRGSQSVGLYKLPMGGGVPQLLFPLDAGVSDYHCSIQPANLCAYGMVAADQKNFVITSFDVDQGNGNELLRIPVEPETDNHWSLSPDGKQVAILKHEEGTSQVRLFPVHGGGSRTIEAKGYSQLQSIDWAPDSKSMFVATEDPEGARVLRVGVDGKVHPIWRQPQPLRTWGVPSPNGRYLTIFGTSEDANVWMIDNF